MRSGKVARPAVHADPTSRHSWLLTRLTVVESHPRCARMGHPKGRDRDRKKTADPRSTRLRLAQGRLSTSYPSTHKSRAWGPGSLGMTIHGEALEILGERVNGGAGELPVSPGIGLTGKRARAASPRSPEILVALARRELSKRAKRFSAGPGILGTGELPVSPAHCPLVFAPMLRGINSWITSATIVPPASTRAVLNTTAVPRFLSG
jgi:hypothetical protein